MFSSILIGKVSAELAKVDFESGPMPPLEAAQTAIRDAAQLVAMGERETWKEPALKAAYCLWRAAHGSDKIADDGDVVAHYADHCAGVAGRATELLRRLAALAWKEGQQGEELMRDVRAYLAALGR